MLRRRTLLALVVTGLMLLGPMFGGPASAQEYHTIKLKTFQTGEYQAVQTYPEEGVQKTGIDIETMAVVFNASMSATSGAYSPNGLDYPRDPYIDIGGDGTIDWKYTGIGYGRWGLQDVFNDGSDMINLTFEANETREVRFKMPKGADVLGGSFTTGGWPVPYWGPEFVVSNTETESKGEFGPELQVYNGMMFEAWESKDPTITDGNDFDIVYRIFDGESWTEPREISPPGDYLEDDSPNLVVFQGKLYCVWSASETEDFFANDDIFLRWTEDGENWSPLKKVSPVIRAAMNDWPAPVVYQGKLYIFWKTMDDTIADVSNENDMDIVYRWWDGTNFGPIEEITKGDDGAIDWCYDVTIYNNRLYIVWETDVGDIWTYQVDIMVKSFDGISWTNRKNLSPSDDDIKDEIPRFYVWFNPVKKMDELYVIWGRGDGQADGSGDIDIVIRIFDGMKWSAREEISKPDIRVQNMGHSLIGYEGRLYAIWIDGKESVIVGSGGNLIVFKIFGDIVIRSFDGYEWSTIKELTPYGQTDKASDPVLCVYKDKLYASWSFPNDATSSSDDWDIILRNIDFQDVTLDIDIGKDGTVDWSGELSSSIQVIPLNRTQIEEAMVGGSIVDDHGNEITEVAIKIMSKFPAKIRVHDLKIEYEYKIDFDFTDQLNALLEAGRPTTDGTDDRQMEETTNFPLEAGTGSEGKIIFKDLEIEYLVNYAPFLVREIPVLYMDEDTDWPDALDLEEYFSDDWDDGRLRFRIVSMEDANLLDAYLTGSNMSFRTPTENWYGTSNITIVTVDGFDVVSHPYVITVVVRPVNDLPILDFIPDQRLKAGERFKYQATAYDVDRDILSYNDTTVNFNIDKDTGVISFIPSHRGKFEVNISVSDGHGGFDHQVVTFTVEGEATSSDESTCFSLAGLLLLALALTLVAIKLRHDIKWGPVAPERLRIPTEEKEKAGAKEGKGVAGARRTRKGGKRRRRAPPRKKSVVIPGTDTTYDRYDANKDGFLDEQEWEKAVDDIKRQKTERTASIKARAKKRARKDLDPDTRKRSSSRTKKKAGRGRPVRKEPPEPKVEDEGSGSDEYLPPGMRKRWD